MKYVFGSMCVEADARRISGSAGPMHLTRKAFDLLLLLLERRPDAVSKEQIYTRLWPDTFVAESSLQTLIHEIRQAIDDRGSRQSWIRTVHGIGYSFAGDVVVSEAPSARPPFERPAAWLVGESTRIGLHPGENILGRELEDVVEIDLPTISRRHARLVIGDSVTVEDLGSKNGTWLHEQRLAGPRVLADGDEVWLGSAKFTFRLVRSPKSTESSEMPRPDVDPTSS